MSGLPGTPESRPSLQPLMPDRIKSDRNLHSVVFVPLDLMRLITRERVALLNVSKYLILPFCNPTHPMNQELKQFYCEADRAVSLRAVA